MARELPTGTVTFLFTDMEGSTRLLQSLGEAYEGILDEHHRLLRDAFAAHGGIEVSTEGDAFFVVFTAAGIAVAGAAAAQRALAQHSWDERVDVRVRMGLHSGNGVLLGDDYVGLDVHRAARITSAAHGGQILVSEATRVLAEPALEGRLHFEDLGVHVLRDLEQPEHVYQVAGDGLESRFPAVRSLSPRPTNVPKALTSFVSRDRELGEITNLVRLNRVVTLTGPGGAGKSRLALEFASHALEEFPDGTYFVALSSVGDPGLVASTIAETLGIREEGTRPVEDSLAALLQDKEMLLVLDNFEHLLPAAVYVATLAAATKLRLVVTSRAPLRISGEQEFPVPPMSLPDPERLPEAGRLLDYESLELFARRARAVNPSFELNAANARAVVEICRRCDGLPLAIELAAARTRMLSPNDIAARLGAGLDVLGGGARNLPPRQQSLRNAIAWSYDLLDDRLRTFFGALSVFSGGCTIEAAERVCNSDDDGRLDTLDALTALTDHSLVRCARSNLDQTRFHMLETIHEFAAEMLAPDERATLQRRHALYFVDLGASMGTRFTEDPDLAEVAETEHDNLRAALRWSLEGGEAAAGLRLGAALWRFWMLKSHLAEGRRWLTDLLALPAATELGPERARALLALGSVTYWQNDFRSTRRYYDESLRVFTELGDELGMAQAVYNAAFPSLLDGDFETARRAFRRSRELAKHQGDDLGVANTSWGLALVALKERDLDAATRLGEEARDAFVSLGNWFGLTQARFIFFQVARFRRDQERARRLVVEMLDDMSEHKDLASISWVLQTMAAVEVAHGHAERAVTLAGAADVFAERYGGGPPPPLVELEDPRALVAGALSTEDVERLWRAGRAMSSDEALAYARKDPSA